MATINKIKVGATTYDVGGQYTTCTLSTTWSGTAPDLSQTVAVSGITADSHPVLDVVISASGNIDAETEAWSKVWKATSGAGTITFYASEATSTALTVAVKY